MLCNSVLCFLPAVYFSRPAASQFAQPQWHCKMQRANWMVSIFISLLGSFTLANWIVDWYQSFPAVYIKFDNLSVSPLTSPWACCCSCTTGSIVSHAVFALQQKKIVFPASVYLNSVFLWCNSGLIIMACFVMLNWLSEISCMYFLAGKKKNSFPAKCSPLKWSPGWTSVHLIARWSWLSLKVNFLTDI